MSTPEQGPYKARIMEMSEDLARREAVEIAIDLIHASFGGASTGSSTALTSHLKNLSAYADAIEAAVKRS